MTTTNDTKSNDGWSEVDTTKATNDPAETAEFETDGVDSE